MTGVTELLPRAKYGLAVGAVTVFILGLVVNWLNNPIRITPLALTQHNSGMIELAYLLGIGYLAVHLAEGRLDA